MASEFQFPNPNFSGEIAVSASEAHFQYYNLAFNIRKKIDLYLRKSVNAEKNCTSENWFEEVINPNAIYDNTNSAEKFFRTTLTNQDGNFELDSPTNYETCVSSERLEKRNRLQ